MMFMTFFVLLISLLIERFFDWSHLRNWQWFSLLQRKAAERLPGKQPWLVLICSLVPVLLVVAFVGYLLSGALYGFATLLFQLFILLYCLGPQNLWADTFVCINAVTKGDAKSAAEKLKALFGVTDLHDARGLHKQLLNHIFLQANQRIFAVVFWFVVFGPIGALLYRLIAISAADASSPAVAAQARTAENLLDWLPVRFFTFIFALGGHFPQVVNSWRKRVLQGVASNEVLLMDCGVAALGGEPDGIIADNGSAEREAVSLLDRVFVMVLVIVLALAMMG